MEMLTLFAGLIVFPTRVGMNRALRPRARFGRRVFPTRVGMNRDGKVMMLEVSRIPHTRGDEP